MHAQSEPTNTMIPPPTRRNTPRRSRIPYGLLLLLVTALGLLSRKWTSLLPAPYGKDIGDVLYAVMVFLVLGLLLPGIPTFKAAIAASLFCCLVEVSKMWHLPLLTPFRNTSLGHLLLGYGFSWSNLVCYGIGVGIGAAIESGYRFSQRQRHLRE